MCAGGVSPRTPLSQKKATPAAETHSQEAKRHANSVPTDRHEGRPSTHHEVHELPLLQQTTVLEHLHNHDGILMLGELHEAHLQQHRGF